MTSFNNSLKRHSGQQDLTRVHPCWATVVDYNPADGTCRVTLQPDNTTTGWLPINYPTVGNGMGVVSPPNIGQMVLVNFEGGSYDDPVVMGGSYNQSSPPPTIAGNPVQSGEVAIVGQNGAFVYWKANGDVDVSSTTNINLVVGSTSLMMNSTSITATAGGHTFVLNSSGLTIDGVVFEGHGHTGIQSGSSISGGPVNP